VLRFEGPSPTVRLHLLRRYVESGIGESSIFELLGMWIEHDGRCLSITEKAQLRYTNSHHNWRDVAEGTIDGVRYRFELTFSLDTTASAWTCTLSAADATTTREVLPPQRLTPTAGPIASWGQPWFLPVHVSEVMPENRSRHKDEAGDFDPWIELFNPSADAVDLGAYSLSDDPADRRRWTFRAGTVIPRHGHLVVFADGQPTQGPLHTSFRLTAGAIILTAPSGTTAGERRYTAPGPDRSLVYDQATDSYLEAGAPSPGAGSSF
jgi:hypothetical protein